MRIVFENRNSKRLAGALLSVLCLAGCWLTGGSVKAILVLVPVLVTTTILRLEIDKQPILKAVYLVAFFLFPFFTFILGQILQSVTIFTVSSERILLNMGLFLILQLTALIITGNIRLSMIVGLTVPLLFTLINAYVYLLRGNALTPSDFLSIKTAANVVAQYNFAPTITMIYAISLAAILILGLFSLPDIQKITGIAARILQILLLIICIVSVAAGCSRLKVFHWTDSGSTYNGYILNFILQIKETFVKEPDNYNSETIASLELRYPRDAGVPSLQTKPDILVIMDESFADFSVFVNGPSANSEITPFINSLQYNVVRGYAYASVFGGSTSNSEYEFLTGNTMAFLPYGAIAYQQFFQADTNTIISYLKGKGYQCVAMHPFLSKGWMRDTIYPAMGFDKTIFLEDFPQKNLVREYVGDQEMFEEIIKVHQQQDENTPLFLFGVTMQNHGGYTYEGPNYEKTITLEGYSRNYPEAEQYMSLIHETDKAVKYLIEYYESIERDVVIVFFGDHMPNVETAFYEELNGGAFDTLDEQMQKQMVPFFIWTNYDIEEKNVPCSSINYLSTYVLEAAGIPLPPYQQFLKETESQIPAINAYGYYSLEKQGFAELEEASGTEREAIHAYEILQYNDIFDEENRSMHFFGN